ncbi:MAG: hypothetical protein U5K31_09460 [Balneolaceae bacterium]|nr:hypothetical protein [Balneolaceae bacterium]
MTGKTSPSIVTGRIMANPSSAAIHLPMRAPNESDYDGYQAATQRIAGDALPDSTANSRYEQQKK